MSSAPTPANRPPCPGSRTPWKGLGSVLFLAGLILLQRTGLAQDVPAVAAAANLRFVLTELGRQFGEKTGRAVRTTFGSSGNFRRQIAQGAPFEVYLSADEAYVQQLVAEGLTEDEGVVYALGRIVLYAPHNGSIKPDPELRDLGAAVSDGRLKRLAIANPEHAPYGRAAQEALETAGLWDQIRRHLILGENAAQAAQFTVSGSAQCGIIPSSLAVVPALARLGTFSLLSSRWHKPIRQRMVLLKQAGETARLYFAFLQSTAARDVFRRYGFELSPADIP